MLSNATYGRWGEHLQNTQDPLGGDKTVREPHTFTVETSGGLGALSCLWQKDGETIPEADTESYITLSLTPEDEGSYLAIVFDEVADVVQSNTAVLNVTNEILPLTGVAGAVVLLGVFGLGGALAIQRRRR